MVVQFGISNFLTYFDPAVVQFTTNSKESKFSETDCVGNRFYNCLKYTAIFGSNASGKSSFINAIDFFANAVRNNNLLKQAANLYCKTKKEHQDIPSSFEIVLSFDDVFYQYGFSVLFKTGKILEEYLNKITPSTKSSSVLFDRNTKNFNFDLGVRAKKDFDYRIDDSIQRDILFLTNVGSLLEQTEENREELIILLKVYKYIKEQIIIIDKNVKSQYLFAAKEISDDFITILRQFDFNIESIKKSPVDKNTLLPFLSDDIRNDIAKKVNDTKGGMSSLIANNKLFIFNFKNGDLTIDRIYFKHFNSSSDFEYLEESDGTLRIMDFIPILLIGNKNVESTFFVDEIEQSLSSDLVIRLFEILREHNSASQIVFTTHLDRLFDRKHFRKDEIYIVDKDKNGESHFTRFNQFDSPDNINAKYLDGRYGGRPKLF